MLWCPTQGSCPSLGRGSGYLHEHHMQLPMGDKCPSQPLVSASPCLLRLPSQPLEASGPSFTKCFPLPLFFPTPGSSLFLPPLSSPLSVPTYSCPILLREWTLGGYSIPPLRLWDLPPLLAMAPLEEWQAEVGEACLTPCSPWFSKFSPVRD